jgi:hypothetical protein
MSPVSWQTKNVVSFFFLLLAMVANNPYLVVCPPNADAYYAERMQVWLAHFRYRPTFGWISEPARLGLHPNSA